MKILTIDAGTWNLGWAIGSPGEKPDAGTYHPPKSVGKDVGWLLVDVRSFIAPLLSRRRVTHVGFASPLILSGDRWMTTRKMCAITGLVEVIAYDVGIAEGREIRCEEEDERIIRTHFLGRGNVPKHSDDIGRAVCARCAMLGYDFDTDHAADALAVLDYMLAVKSSVLSRKIGELL